MDNGHHFRDKLEGGISALFHESRTADMLTMDPAFFVAWRKRQGFTQVTLSERIHVNLFTVKRWEGGSRKIPPYMGLIMAAIENDLEPIGTEAMIEVEGSDD
ncbi:hypothetical protein G8E10_24770 [Rhizobiaceae bacterium CRRU44]|uniref:Uncharacterized protein n=1 Tax=Ferranicluibacter rubi TaxID=2715133 RepID=A0AA43ZM11_9HYPH|nr:hypothetical protein [Ferranicluibacter rubi]NHT78916.1 hypothetical protein [Ferranicluibacter rubi]